ncbi:hypothetical protein AB0C24_13570 [Amycolatopsis japonica]|uniref:hypothetical protein n=1 Tax=Amycolatopsis japonica TaxID=208439 RepID=UPI0033F33DA9
MTDPAPARSRLAALPSPHTPVLAGRPLRPGTVQSGLSVFADDRWRLGPAVFEQHTTSFSIEFTTVDESFRDAVKVLTWLLLNHPAPTGTPYRLRQGMLAITTIIAVQRCVRLFTDWLAGRGLIRLADVTANDLDDYAVQVKAAPISLGRREDLLAAVNRIWAYRDLLPESDRLPAAPPWRGERIQDVLQQRRPDRGENRTPRIHPDTMSALLAWSVRFVDVLADDIITAFDEQRALTARGQRARERGGTAQPAREKFGVTALLETLLADYRANGRPLPGRRRRDGTIGVNVPHLAKLLDVAPGSLRVPTNQALLDAADLPIREGSPLAAPITAHLDGVPWRDTAVDFHEAPTLARHLSTACFIVIAYLSGMRPGEVLSLERGCVDHVGHQPVLRGRHWKGVLNDDGDKRPDGEIRADPWVIPDIAAAAVAVLCRLHPHALLFPSTLHTDGRNGAALKKSRLGTARTSGHINGDIAAFLEWIEAYCREHRRPDRVPPDPVEPVITVSRLRRTLAWFIVRRPRGLIAAAIQYGHLQTSMTLGYAGNYASGFPDDLAFEHWLARVDTLADAHQHLLAGEHVSGPAATTYRHRVENATRFAGRTLRTTRDAHTMLTNPDLQIFPGNAMTCVLDPQRAACRLRGEENSTRRTPDLDDCRPNCANIARTDRDIDSIRQMIQQLRPIVDDPLAPPFRHAREQHELQRLERIVADHDQPGEHRP